MKKFTLTALAAIMATATLAQSAKNDTVIGLDEVRVISSFAKDRKTPVAVSTVTASTIKEVYGGSTELPEILKVTPGMYASKSGGGVGDARMNIRGFDQRNVAVLINGIPVNDMENGWVYWSNWAGLGDAVSTIQVQRGLGASKLAINSIGGTMNIITNPNSASAGGSVQVQRTDYGMNKITAYAATGLMKNGFAMSAVISRTTGTGYVDGTWFKGHSYFVTASKRLTASQNLVFTIVGAPQEHGQRSTGLDSTKLADYGRKYNPDLGTYTNGDLFNERINYYHKPQASLNHYMSLSPNTKLNTSLYFSVGHGGGSGRLGSSYKRTAEGAIDIEKAVAFNIADSNQASSAKYAQRNSVNNHTWYGALSTMSHKINDNLELTAGLDARYYLGRHFREVRDLLGAQFYDDKVNGHVTAHEFSSDYINLSHVVPADQRVQYDNDGIVKYAGLFGQLEYTKNRLSAFVTGAINTTSNTRVDRMTYVSDTTGRGETSETINIPGFSTKAGANFNINETSNIYGNAGYFSRAPFFGNDFVNNSNDVVQNLLNEKAISLELGYGYTTKRLALKVNAYHTQWKDKALLSGNITGPNGTMTRALMSGANATHQGVEVEFNSKPMKNFELGGMASFGNWRWVGDIDAIVYSEVDPTQSTTVKAYVDGLHVGDAPQTQMGLQARYQMGKFFVGTTYVYNARFYANFDPSGRKVIEDKVDAYQIPNFFNLDGRVGYATAIGKYRMELTAQGYNLTDEMFWSDVTDNKGAFAYGFPGFGRNFNLSAKFIF